MVTDSIVVDTLQAPRNSCYTKKTYACKSVRPSPRVKHLFTGKTGTYICIENEPLGLLTCLTINVKLATITQYRATYLCDT